MSKTAGYLGAGAALGLLWVAMKNITPQDIEDLKKAMGLQVNIPANFAKYRPTVDKYLSKYDIPRAYWPYVYALVHQESGWDPNSFRAEPRVQWGNAGDASYGLFQLLQSTASGLGFKGENLDLYEVETNCKYGAMLIRRLLDRFGNLKDALSAYNSGKPLASAPASTVTNYVPSIVAMGNGTFSRIV